MACSRFEYVKVFERFDKLLPGCWTVIRLDGRSFTSFAKKHNFHKPNDKRALQLCNAAAMHVLETFDSHLNFAFGESDEFSFILRRESTLFSRREQKIVSTVVSLFTSAYVFNWSRFLPDVKLLYPPCFDGRAVLYPTTRHLRDYLSWRQADVHVNNLYNTVFWALVQRGGLSGTDAEKRLKGTLAKDKHEIMFTEFGINYNDEDAMFRKGSFLMRKGKPDAGQHRDGRRKRRREEEKEEQDNDDDGEYLDSERTGNTEDGGYETVHVDIIGDKFWDEHEHLLQPSDLQPPRIRKS